MELKDGNTEPGAEVWLNTGSGADKQLWRLTAEGYLESKLGLVVEIAGSNVEQGAIICGWSKTDKPKQKWTLMSDSSLQNELNSLVLDVQHAKSDPEAELWVWARNGSNSQKWSFISVEDDSASSKKGTTVRRYPLKCCAFLSLPNPFFFLNRVRPRSRVRGGAA